MDIRPQSWPRKIPGFKLNSYFSFSPSCITLSQVQGGDSAVVFDDLLLIVVPLFWGIYAPCFVTQYIVLCVLSSLAIIPLRKREPVALLKLYSCCVAHSKCSVFLPHGAVGWSVVCDCSISWLYLLNFLSNFTGMFHGDPLQ